jgi:hypothetical protein
MDRGYRDGNIEHVQQDSRQNAPTPIGATGHAATRCVERELTSGIVCAIRETDSAVIRISAEQG